MQPQTPHSGLFRFVRGAAAVLGALALVLLLLRAFAPVRIVYGETDAVGLEIDKIGPNVISVNEPISYTILITNSSGVPVSGIVITDTWNQQFFDGVYEVGGQVVTTSFAYSMQTQPRYAQWTIQPLPAGATGFIRFTMVVTPAFEPRWNFGPTTLGNSAVITTSTPGVPAGFKNVDTLIVGPVLRLTKTFTPTRPRAGRLLTYTFLLENLNRSDAITGTGIVITEKLPNNTIYYAAYPPSIASYNPGTNIVSWALPQPLPVSSTTRVTLTVRVTPTIAAGASIQNFKANCGVYANAAPSTIPCATDVFVFPDEALEKVTQATIPPSQSGPVSKTFPNRLITYTVFVYNPFNEDVTGMLVTDTLPTVNAANPLPTQTFQYSGLLPFSSPQGPPTVISQSARSVAWQLPAIPGWGLYTFTFNAYVPPQMWTGDNPPATGRRYENWLNGSYAGLNIALNTGSNDDSMKIDVVPQVRPFKSVTPTEQLFSWPVTYTLTLSNSGPTTIRNIQVTDTLPTSAYCGFQWESFVSGLPPTFASGNTVAWNQGITLTGYAMTTVATFRATVYGASRAECENTVGGYSPDTYIPRFTNLARVRVLPPFGAIKTANRSSVVLGETLDYTARVFNLSSVPATMNAFTDVLPLGFLYNGNPIYADFTTLTLQPHQQNEYSTTFTVLVRSTPLPCDSLPQTIPQKAGTFGERIIDPPQLAGFWSNSGDHALVVVHPHARAYKSADPPGALPGGLITFTIVLSNNTGSPINNVRVTDTLPSGFTFNSMVSGSPPIQTGPPNVVWDGQTIPGNGKLTLIFRANAATTVGYYVNNVKAAVPSNPLICIPKAQALTVPVKRGQIEVNKTATPRTVNPLGRFLYDISLKNIGPYTITIGRFTDTLPGVPGHIWKFEGMQSGTNDPAPASTNPPAWANLTIGPDRTQRLRFFVRTDIQVGTYPNTVTLVPLAGYMTASLPSNWTLTWTQQFTGTPVTVIPGVGLIKEVFPETQLAGQAVVYTITLVNVSGSPINNVRITDTLPSGFSYEAMVSGATPISTNPLVWSFASVGSGEANKVVLAFRVRIAANKPTGTYYNQVAARADDISIASTGDIAPVVVSGIPTLNLSKSVVPAAAIAGRVVTYTLTLVNPDNDEAVVNARITDTLPSGFSFQSMVSGPPPISTSPKVVWAPLTIPANSSMTLVFRASIAPGLADGTYYNQLDGSSSLIVFQGTGPTAPVSVVMPRFDVQVSKSDGSFTNTVGGTALYTIRYTNTLNALGLAAKNAVLTETFSPAGWLIAGAPGWNFVSPGVYTRALGNLAAGATGSVTFALQIDAGIPAQYLGITNTVRIGASAPDNVPEAVEQPTSNNVSTDIDIIRGADLRVTGIGRLPGPLQQGRQATFVVTVTNVGVDPTRADPTATSDTTGWFWVDLYMKPVAQVPNASTPPSGPHDRYRSHCLDAVNVPCTVQEGPGGSWIMWWNGLLPSGRLAPGQSITATFRPAFPTGGLHYMYAQADIEWPGVCVGQFAIYYCGSPARGRILEADEQNNISGPLIVNVQSNIYLPIVLRNR